MDHLANFDKLKVEAIRQAVDLATALERGQANQPLAELARNASATSSTLSLVLLANEPTFRLQILQWLVGVHHHLVAIHLSASQETIEIKLQERGFTLETDQGGRREFSTGEQFTDAIKEYMTALGNEGHGIERVAVGLSAPSPLHDLSIFVLPKTEIILRTGSANLATSGSILMVAFSAYQNWTEADQSILRLLAPSTAVIWPVVRNEEDGKYFETIKNQIAQIGLPILPPLNLVATVSGILPVFITDNTNNSLRASLASASTTQTLNSLAEMLHERYETDLAQLRSRLKRETRLEGNVEAGSREQIVKAEFEKMRTRANEEFTALSNSLRENIRRSVTRTGTIGKSLRKIADLVKPIDLEHENTSKAVRLTLSPHAIDDVQKRYLKVLRQFMDEQCVIIRDSGNLFRTQTEESLRLAGSSTLSIPMESPDSGRIWDSLHEATLIEVKYQSEMPKRGFMQRLGQGRQMVFGILMVLSLVGNFIFPGSNFRRMAIVGLVLLFVFVGAVMWTFHSWKREDEEKISKEIEKVQEGVLTELEKLASEGGREIQVRLLEHLDQAKRDYLYRLENIMRELLTTISAEVQSQTSDTRNRIKLLQQRERDFLTVGQQVTKFRQQVESATSSSQLAIQEVVKSVSTVGVGSK